MINSEQTSLYVKAFFDNDLTIKVQWRNEVKDSFER